MKEIHFCHKLVIIIFETEKKKERSILNAKRKQVLLENPFTLLLPSTKES